MHVIKLGFISLIVIFIILLLISLLIPSTVRVSRAINIHTDKTSLYPLLADTMQWRQWNLLINDSIDVRIVSSDSNVIHSRWTYRGRSLDGYYRLEAGSDVVVVQWYFEFALKWYPWEKFGSITFENQFGPPMERSLINLKNLVTKSP